MIVIILSAWFGIYSREGEVLRITNIITVFEEFRDEVNGYPYLKTSLLILYQNSCDIF